jgi:hypothetical protein
LKLFLEWGRRKIKENLEGGNSSMIYLLYCKNLCKFHNVPLPSTIIKFFKVLKKVHDLMDSLLNSITPSKKN